MTMNRYGVGPQYGATGSNNDQGRVSISGAHIVSDAHGHFFEAVRLGITATGQGVWSATTGVAGVAPGTALSTTPPMAVWNPVSSGVLLAILVTRVGYISGTLGAGQIAYAYVGSQNAKPTTGTPLTVNPVLIGSQATPRAQAFQGSTLSATPTLLNNPYAIITAANASSLKDVVDSEIVVLPGGVFVMQGVAAAGTTPLVTFGVTWEEVPLLY